MNSKSAYALVGALLIAMNIASYAGAEPTRSEAAEQATTVSSTDRVRDAPGRGLIATISPHTGVVPKLYQLDKQPVEALSPLIGRQVLHGAQSTFVKWTMKKGAVVPVHHHPNEQITWFISGAAIVYSQGRKYQMKAGDILIIPPNVPHEFHFTDDTIDIDIFAPQRQDWIDGTAAYIPNFE